MQGLVVIPFQTRGQALETDQVLNSISSSDVHGAPHLLTFAFLILTPLAPTTPHEIRRGDDENCPSRHHGHLHPYVTRAPAASSQNTTAERTSIFLKRSPEHERERRAFEKD